MSGMWRHMEWVIGYMYAELTLSTRERLCHVSHHPAGQWVTKITVHNASVYSSSSDSWQWSAEMPAFSSRCRSRSTRGSTSQHGSWLTSVTMLTLLAFSEIRSVNCKLWSRENKIINLQSEFPGWSLIIWLLCPAQYSNQRLLIIEKRKLTFRLVYCSLRQSVQQNITCVWQSIAIKSGMLTLTMLFSGCWLWPLLCFSNTLIVTHM